MKRAKRRVLLDKVKKEKPQKRFVVASTRAEYYNSVTSVLGQFRFKKNILKARGFITGEAERGIQRRERRIV